VSNIRRLDLTDLEAAEEIWALQHAAYRQEAALIGAAELPPLRETVVSLQCSEEAFYGFYSADDELTGVVSVKDADGRMTICRMMVDPAYFRQGIASALLQYLTDDAFPGRTWMVNAEVRNVPAIRLYEQSGFERTEVWHPSPGLTMARMCKPCTAPGA